MTYLNEFLTKQEYLNAKNIPLDSVSLIKSTGEVKYGSSLLEVYEPLKFIGSKPLDKLSGAYLNTGVIPKMNTKIEVSIVEIGPDTVICGGWKTQYNYEAFGINNDVTSCYAAFLNDYSGDLPLISDADHVITLDASKVTLDGETIHIFQGQPGPFPEDMVPICFFGTLRGSKVQFFSDIEHPKTYKLKLSNIKIYEGDNIIRDFYPVKRRSDANIGMYDLVNQEFYTSANPDFSFIGE